MNLKQALERIEALERRVRELEARPAQHVHYHQHPSGPIYTPGWQYIPQPSITPLSPWYVTYGGGGVGWQGGGDTGGTS